MGWTYQHATYYKNGKIDRKAECDAYFTESNAGWYKVEKSALVGKVYYAAIRRLRGFLENLPIGTVIKCCETELVKSNPAGQFKKPFWRVKGKWAYYQKKVIQARGFEIISKPATV